MENSLAYKWVAALFFGIVGVMFTASVIYLAAGNVAPDTYWGKKMTLSPSSTTGPSLSVNKHVLEVDNGVTIGNRIFIFKGRQGDTLHFNVIIPELDRQYPYPFKVDLSQSKNGFEMAGIWF
jgi:hypothetical protein